MLRAWRDSGSERKRSAYKVLRKGVLYHYFGLPGAARDAIGFPGPVDLDLAEPESSRPRRSRGCRLRRSRHRFRTGGARGGVLAEAGLDVLVLEAGGDGRYRREELDAFWAHYLEAGVPPPTTSRSTC